MKNKRILIIILLIIILVTGCTKSVEIDGKKVYFDKEYNDGIIAYKYPGEFKELKPDGDYTTMYEKKMEYVYKENKDQQFILRIEEYQLSKSFREMEEECNNIETSSSYKNLKKEKTMAKNSELRKYSYRTNDQYGDNTLYHVYFGKFYATGLYKYIKVYFINAEDKEEFEETFLSTFIIKP